MSLHLNSSANVLYILVTHLPMLKYFCFSMINFD